MTTSFSQTDAPTDLQVVLDVCRNITARFLDMVHDIRLVHHVPLTIGYKLLELIRQ